MEKSNFGVALEAIKQGNKIAREGWNGKGMFLFYNNGRLNTISYKAVSEGIIENGLEVAPFILMKTADNKLVPWLASQTDVLAEDWIIIN